MPRVKRRIFNILTGLSLLLCVATAGLWMDSYWKLRVIDWFHDVSSTNKLVDFGARATSFRGGVVLTFSRIEATMTGWINGLRVDRNAHKTLETCTKEEAINAGRTSYLNFKNGTSHLGFQLDSPRKHANGITTWAESVAIPFWFPFILFASLPLWRLWLRHKRRIRAQHGKCQQCGYDLRATPDRCPECGTASPPMQNTPGL
jgi:hypothetical protein